MRKILAALLVGFVAMMATTAIAAPVTGTTERAVGNIAFTPLQDESGWVKYTKESGDLVTSWHAHNLVVGGVYDLQFVYTPINGVETTILIAEDVVAEATQFDDLTYSTYGSIELINQVTNVPVGDYRGVFELVGTDGSIVSATSSFTIF